MIDGYGTKLTFLVLVWLQACVLVISGHGVTLTSHSQAGSHMGGLWLALVRSLRLQDEGIWVQELLFIKHGSHKIVSQF